MASANIFQQYLQPPKSVLDYSNEYDKQQSNQLQLAAQRLQGQQAQQEFNDTNALRALYSSGVDLSTPEGQAKLMSTAPTKAGAILAQRADIAQKQSEVTKNNATAANTLAEADSKAIAAHRDQLAGVSDLASARAWVASGYQDPKTAPILTRVAGPMDQALKRIPDPAVDPKGFQNWLGQNALGATKYIELNKPQITTQNLGGSSQIVATPGLGGAPTILSNSPITQSADNAATNATSRANNAATQAGENARAAASRVTQLRLGGYDANGNLLDLGIGGGTSGASPMGGLVDAIGQYKTPEGVALGRVPPALKSQVLAAVLQKYPDYDPSTFGARQKAARDFGTGNQGNAMRSFAVAGQHLDQLGELADALNNGNLQIVNRIGNAYAQQTGNPAPTNFDAAKDVVSKEVVKAIVAGGGGVAERQELSNLMSNAKSPAQLRGVIDQYRGLMAAQHDALLVQRRAAGLPDSTLPNYGPSAAGGSAHPADINALLNKYAPAGK